MKRILFALIGILALSTFTGCDPQPTAATPIEVVFFQLNDVYEITPLENDAVGGMARVQAYRKQLLAQNPNTVTVLAGDFLNPSGMGQVVVDGGKLYGKQMVDLMNRVGVDWVTFGNHEFDLKEASLLDRISESEFGWISANVLHKVDSSEKPFEHKGKAIPRHQVLTFRNGQDSLRIGIISVTLNDNEPSYTHILDFVEEGKKAYAEVEGQCDFVIALTHLSIEQDKELAAAIPGLRLIMGGHEHTIQEAVVGETVIKKADANAKSAFVHTLKWDPVSRKLQLDSRNVKLDAQVEQDAEMAKVVQDWVNKVYDGLRADGFAPDSAVATVTEPLDGLESSNRTHRTNLGTLIAESMQAAWPGTQLALCGSGSIRIDDMVSGKITQYDIVRILPFGGSTMQVSMPGAMLTEMMALGTSDSLKGNGGFLQYAGIDQGADGQWIVAGKPIDPKKSYSLAAGDYLIQFEKAYLPLYDKYKGKYKLTAGTQPQQTDVRLGLIEYMSKQEK